MGWDNRVQVHVYNQACDMRKAHDGLASLCDHVLQRNPLSGEVFVFMNKKRDRLKALYWDGTGLCLLYKRLESGKFTNLWKEGASTRLSTMELRLLLEGARLEGKLPLTPPEFVLKNQHRE